MPEGRGGSPAGWAAAALVFFGLNFSGAAPAPVTKPPPFPGSPLLLQLPLADMPYGLGGGFQSPSMRQSLLTHAAFMQFSGQSLVWAWERPPPGFLTGLGKWVSLGLFEYFSTYIPPGGAWLHEEWHRAVLTQAGVPSFDGVYYFDIGAEFISVDHVRDADLAAMKAERPEDFVRLMEAGIEGEIESARLMRRGNFFLGRSSGYDVVHWLASGLNTAAYLYICATRGVDADLDLADARESDVGKRDFTGLDFRAWVYDMRHPDEPYAAGPRGRPHPSGTGFNRYLRYDDLTPSDRSYLRWQAGLSLLNLVTPQLVGFDELPGPDTAKGWVWNFGLFHHLTPFGFDLGADFLWDDGARDWAFTLQVLCSGELVLPGLSAELYRYALRRGRFPLLLTAGASAWLQPSGLRYAAGSFRPGGAGLLGAALPLGRGLELFLEGDVKSGGWMAGNVYLDAAAQARTGLQWRL